MNLGLTKEQKAARERDEDEGSFRTFLEHPMTKLSLGMIPPAENPDVMRLLLRAAFDAGKSRGTGAVVSDLLGSMLDRKDKEGGKAS